MGSGNWGKLGPFSRMPIFMYFSGATMFQYGGFSFVDVVGFACWPSLAVYMYVAMCLCVSFRCALIVVSLIMHDVAPCRFGGTVNLPSSPFCPSFMCYSGATTPLCGACFVG